MPELKTKSHGLMGLPHYRNSRASVELYEPIYQNIFTVNITLPASVGATQEEVNLVLEGVQKIGGLETSKLPTSPAMQHYKFADRSYAGSKPDNTHVDLDLDFQLNLRHDENRVPTNYAYNLLRKWTDLIYDPLTGRSGLKRDYVAPNMIVTVQDRAGTPYWGWIFYNIFPISNLPTPDLNYQSTDLLKVPSFKLRCDIWDEVRL